MSSDTQTQPLSSKMTVLSLVNGMIGGFILILPVFALQTGYMSTLIVIIITGTFSYFSSHLCVIHIGNQPDLDVAIFKHFGKSVKMKNLYDIGVWISLLLIDVLYFELIVIQWVGLAPPHEFTTMNAILNGFMLFGITMAMKYFQFGANLMAYGVISIVSYLIFLTWVVGSEETNATHRQYQAFGQGVIELAAGMGQAFAIQGFFIPIIKKSINPKNGQKLVMIAYIIGAIAYSFIAFMGSYGILYRDYLGYSDGQRTIEGYFGVGTWEVNLIELIYLMHLYSVFPEFLLISKKRFFGVLDYQNTPKGKFSAKEILYITVSITVCLIITLLKLSIRDIIDLNGAVIGCIFIYIIPATMHIRCLYYGKGKVPISEKSKPQQQNKYDVMVQENNLELEKREKNKSDEANEQNADTPTKKNEVQLKQQFQIQEKHSQEGIETYECNCNLSNYTQRERIFNLLLVVLMIGVGIFIMINGIIDLSSQN